MKREGTLRTKTKDGLRYFEGSDVLKSDVGESSLLREEMLKYLEY